MRSMARSRGLRAALWLLIACVAFRAARASEPFDFEKHLPGDVHVYLGGDAGALVRALRESPLGRLYGHPGVTAALAEPVELLRGAFAREWRYFERDYGVSALDVIAHFDGRAAMAWPSVDFREGPGIVVAVELGARRARKLEIAAAMARGESGGKDPVEERYRGIDVFRWQVRYGRPASHAVIGDCLVFAGNGWPIEDLIDRYRGDEKGSLGTTSGYRAAMARAAVSGAPLATLYVDVARFRGRMLEGMREHQRAASESEFQRFLDISGFDSVSTLAYRVGFAGGDLEGKLAIESPSGHGGLIALLAGAASAPQDARGLALVPRTAFAVAAKSVHCGKLARELVEFIGSIDQDSTQAVEAVVGGIERSWGISMPRDVYTLPRIDLFAWAQASTTGSPAPDVLVACKRSSADVYLSFLGRVAERQGRQRRQVEVGGQGVHVLEVAGLGQLLGAREGLFAREARALPPPFDRLLAGGLDPAIGFAWGEVDDEWLVFGSTPQAVARYLARRPALEESIAGAEPWRELLASRVGRRSAFALVRGGDLLLWAYDSAVSLLGRLGPIERDTLGLAGIDATSLPAGAAFRQWFQPGFARLESDERALILHGHGMLTNTAAVTVLPLALAFVADAAAAERRRIAYAEAPVASTPTDEARGGPTPPVAPSPDLEGDGSRRRLLRVGAAIRQWMTVSGSRAYPWSPEGRGSGFQALADADVITDPSLLVHPFSSDLPAPRGEGGRLLIGERQTSYWLVPWRQGPQDAKSRILCFEKSTFQSGHRLILNVGLEVERLREVEFQRRYAEQLARYGRQEEGDR